MVARNSPMRPACGRLQLYSCCYRENSPPALSDEPLCGDPDETPKCTCVERRRCFGDFRRILERRALVVADARGRLIGRVLSAWLPRIVRCCIVQHWMF